MKKIGVGLLLAFILSGCEIDSILDPFEEKEATWDETKWDEGNWQ